MCTGLFEKFDKDLNYYKDLFEKNLDKEMVCTNPDLIVDRGDKRELCAGSVAMVFEKMGGKVVYFGKPYPEVYNLSINNKFLLFIGKSKASEYPSIGNERPSFCFPNLFKTAKKELDLELEIAFNSSLIPSSAFDNGMTH